MNQIQKMFGKTEKLRKNKSLPFQLNKQPSTTHLFPHFQPLPHICMHTRTYTHTHTCVHTHIHARACTCMHTRVHTHAHTYTPGTSAVTGSSSNAVCGLLTQCAVHSRNVPAGFSSPPCGTRRLCLLCG